MDNLPETPDSSSSVPEQQPNVVNQAPNQTAAPDTSDHVPIYDISGPKPILNTIAPEEVTDAVASGKWTLPSGAHINVMSPDGVLNTMDPSEAPQAFQNGWKYATPADLNAQQYRTPGQQVATGAEGLARGLLGPIATGVERGFGISAEGERGRQEANPGIAAGSEVAGFLGPAVATLGTAGLARLGVQGAADTLPAIGAASNLTQAGVMSQAAEAAAKAMGMGGEASSIAGKLAQSGVKMGMETAMYQASDETVKALQEDPNQSAQTAMANIGAAGLFGGVLGAGASGVGQLWKATAGKKLAQALESIKNDANGIPNTSGPQINPILKKVISTFSGVGEKDIDAYAANRAAIQELPSDEDIYAHVEQHIGDINSKVADATADADVAGKAYGDLVNNTKQAYREQGFDAGIAERMARANLKTAQDKLAGQNLDNALRQGPEAAGAVENLRSQVVDGSQQAYDLLSQSGKSIPLANTMAKGEDLVSQLRDKGTLESKAMADRLESYLGQLPKDNVGAPQAKALIQGLDGVSKYNFNSTDFDKGLSGYYKQLRHQLDSDLKAHIPEYAAAMQPVAAKSALLSDLSDYGTAEGATNRIKGLTNPARYQNEMPLLKQLEEQTGSKFTNSIEPYANPEIQERMAQAVPEYAEHQKAAAISQQLKDPKTIQAMKDSLAESSEHQALLKANAKKEAAIAAKQDLRGLTENNIGSKLRAGELSKADALRLLSKIPSMDGKSLPEILSLNRVKKAFEGETKHGSKGVNLMGVLGGVGGEFLTHSFAGSLGGGGLGVAAGAFLDKYGKGAVKQLLDVYLDHFGNVGKMVGKDGSVDTLRAAVSRFIDHDAAGTVAGNYNPGSDPNPEAFKAMTDYIDNLMQGDKLLQKSAKNVFKPDVDGAVPKGAMATDNDKTRLSKNLQKFWDASQDPNSMVEHMNKTIGPVTNYMPEHGAAMTETASNVAAYLKSQKPVSFSANPLDSKPPISLGDKTLYDRTLGLAQQPLTILDYIKTGRITPKDIQDVHAMYPALYAKVAQELTNSMMEHISKGASVPYNTRIGLSLFLGQAMDSTMTPQGIMGAQPMPVPSPQQQTAQGSKSKGSPKSLSELPNAYRTPAQARQNEKQTKE